MMFIKKWIRSSLNFKHIVTIIAAIIFAVAAMFLFSNKISSIQKYQSFINSRNYNYSIKIDKDIGENTYAFYDKKIIFYEDYELNNSFNSTIYMELHNIHNNEDFLYGYDVESLNKNEVAISSNLLGNRFNIGSTVYSKNKVTNRVEQYIIKIILPDIYGVSKEDNENYKGIIVMGLDDNYLQNVDCNYIYFYNDDYSLISNNNANIIGDLNSINSIKKTLFYKHFLYSIISYILITIICSVYFALLASFSKNLYLKKKEYGIVNLYKIIELDFLIYGFLLLLPIELLYLLSLFINSFSIEKFLVCLIVILIISYISILIMKKHIKER